MVWEALALAGVSWGMAASALLVRAARASTKDRELWREDADRRDAWWQDRLDVADHERTSLMNRLTAKDAKEYATFEAIANRPEPVEPEPMVYYYDDSGFPVGEAYEKDVTPHA